MIYFFNDTATTEIYTLSLHDALPISALAICKSSATRSSKAASRRGGSACGSARTRARSSWPTTAFRASPRSEEHTSELQSRQYLVCRLLLEKKNKGTQALYYPTVCYL